MHVLWKVEILLKLVACENVGQHFGGFMGKNVQILKNIFLIMQIILNQGSCNFALHQALWFDPTNAGKQFTCEKWPTSVQQQPGVIEQYHVLMLLGWSHRISSSTPAIKHAQTSWRNLPFHSTEVLEESISKRPSAGPIAQLLSSHQGQFNQKQICLGLAQSSLLISRHINTSHISECISRTWEKLTFLSVLVVSYAKRAPFLLKPLSSE